MQKIKILIMSLVLTFCLGLTIIPKTYAQLFTLFPNPLSIDPTSSLFGTFQNIPQFPIPPFLPGYPLDFVTDLYEVYDSSDPLSTGILTDLPIPAPLIEQGWPTSVTMPTGATYPGTFVTMAYAEIGTTPTIYATTGAAIYTGSPRESSLTNQRSQYLGDKKGKQRRTLGISAT